jgi:uncharacterized protein YmfQ (DUF2313 family)
MGLSYKSLLASLMPTGALWTAVGEDDSRMRQVLAGIAPTLERLEAAGYDLLTELNPATTVALIDDWEAVYGLPDACMTPATTLQQRRDRVLGRIRELGGQSKQYIVDVCARYGYTVTITEQRYFRAGLNRAGQPANGAAHVMSFVVNYPSQAVQRFRAGKSRAGDPLVTYDNDSLECIINRIKPAQTFAFFNYTS